jgi:hypothetical protein
MNPQQLFVRCGHFLCGTGSDWKAQFGAMLMIKPDSVDAMSKGASRIPPGIWRDIAGFIQDREREAPALKAAVLDIADPGPERSSYMSADGRQTAVPSGPRRR